MKDKTLKISVSWGLFCFYKISWSRESVCPLKKKWKCNTWIINVSLLKDLEWQKGNDTVVIHLQTRLYWSFISTFDYNFWKIVGIGLRILQLQFFPEAVLIRQILPSLILSLHFAYKHSLSAVWNLIWIMMSLSYIISCILF